MSPLRALTSCVILLTTSLGACSASRIVEPAVIRKFTTTDVSAAAAPGPLRIDGLVAAVFTPLSDASEVTTSTVPSLYEWLSKTGVEWVFVGGTTGESLSLTVAERMTLAEAWLQTKANVIVHIGAESIVDVISLAKHARKIGAKAVGMMPPTFFKPASVDALAAYLVAVASQVPDLPLYYYNIPTMTGTTFAMNDLIDHMSSLNVKNFVGIKETGLYTFPGFMDAQRCVDHPDYEILFGRDEMTVQALSVGFKGFVGSQYNFAGDLYREIRAAHEAGNSTQSLRLQKKALDLVYVQQNVLTTKGLNVGKAIMNLAVRVGDARLPAVPMTSTDYSTVTEQVRSWCKATVEETGFLPALCNVV